MLRLNSGFENFPNSWGIAEPSRRQESTENGAHTSTSSDSQRAIHMHLLSSSWGNHGGIGHGTRNPVDMEGAGKTLTNTLFGKLR